MPSRTYIQMWLKLYNMDEHHTPIGEGSAKALRKYDYILRQFPELVESVVQQRVDCIRFCKQFGCEYIPEFILVIYEKHLIDIWYEQRIKDRMYDVKFMKQLTNAWLEEEKNE